MNKKIIIILIISLLLIGVFIYINKDNLKSKSNNTKNNSNITIETTKSDTNMDLDIDFTKYKTYDVSLNESYKINSGGLYHLTGSITNGSITINTSENVKLILDSVSITNSNGPTINIEDADNVYIELIGTNTLTSTTNDSLNGCIYSKDDLLLYGDGTLNIKSNYDGIVSKDDLVIKSGTYIINTDDDGLIGKDSLTIEGGNVTINSGGDGLKTTNEDEKGSLTINGGTIKVESKDDGLDSISIVSINGGTLNITTSGSTSKGIKAKSNISITNGTLNLNTTDDAIHSNASISITGGKFEISSGDDAIHADESIVIENGELNITNSHEGIEATYVKIDGGEIIINASDDGINATNKSNKYSTTVEINGGSIKITIGRGDTDAIDSNGNLYVTGGTLDITANSPFDYDGESKYTGGTIIVNGEETNTITNQMMGGGMMPNGGRELGMMQETGNMRDNQAKRGGMIRH